MNRLYQAFAQPILFAMDAENAHRATILALKHLPLPAAVQADPRLSVSAFGLEFPNPLGMAPGFDKGADVPDAMLRLGFGFTEIGTVTPLPQPGNPRPRLFRLREDGAVINRFGFNSEGHARVHARLVARRGRPGIVGVNIGANKTATDRVADYIAGIEAFADVASYFTINISSPNTPGLRDLQQAAVLDDLLARVLDARDRVATRKGRAIPCLLKIAPDLDLAELDDIVRVARARRVDGMIVSNTTIARPSTLVSKEARQTGGLSGRPLFEASTRMLASTYLRVDGQFPLVGVGGIEDAATAIAKLEAGATLLQVYSAMVFKGPQLVTDVLDGIAARLTTTGASHVGALVGISAADWAAR